jgi:endogenous inhibitor of DNA gyrase (YacG/DUF329 family)
MSAAPDACPICGKPKEAKFAPFCSRRCAHIDLGRWLKGGYAIPGSETPKPSSEDEEKPED